MRGFLLPLSLNFPPLNLPQGDHAELEHQEMRVTGLATTEALLQHSEGHKRGMSLAGNN